VAALGDEVDFAGEWVSVGCSSPQLAPAVGAPVAGRFFGTLHSSPTTTSATVLLAQASSAGPIEGKRLEKPWGASFFGFRGVERL
jgi:hypothetical protein